MLNCGQSITGMRQNALALLVARRDSYAGNTLVNQRHQLWGLGQNTGNLVNSAATSTLLVALYREGPPERENKALTSITDVFGKL